MDDWSLAAIMVPLVFILVGAGMTGAFGRAIHRKEGMYDRMSTVWMRRSNLMGLGAGIGILCLGLVFAYSMNVATDWFEFVFVVGGSVVMMLIAYFLAGLFVPPENR